MNIYCINLDKRIDRWNLMFKQFSTIDGINLVRISAAENKHGWIGCGLSHLCVIDNYMDKNSHLVVIEDDCVINDAEHFQEKLSSLIAWLDSNSDKWDIFNGNPSFVNVSNCKILDQVEKIIQCKGGTANFIIYNKNKCDKIKYQMELYRKNLLKWKFDIETNNKKIHHSRKGLPIIDKFLESNFVCITTVPYLTSQYESNSDIEHKNVNYDSILKKSEKNLFSLFGE